MIKLKYKPSPINVSDIELTDDLVNLTEKLAKNVHEIWALGRVNSGWKYGSSRNDEKKLHPCLVPYNELPDSEKEYDRNTAMETIKTIIKLGYKITK